MKILKYLSATFLMIVFINSDVMAQEKSGTSGLIIGRLKYSGGGDWYNDPSAIPNLLKFIKSNSDIKVGDDEKKVQILDEELFSVPILYMTGHGRIQFSDEEVTRLRKYLTSGGFLYADDDYGMDKYFRHEIARVFPDKKLVEIPNSHPIYHNQFEFPKGIPKTHEHDPGPGQAFGIFHEGRLVVLYTFNTNISDGWPDPQVHNDTEQTRQEALRMGMNIMIYALMH